MFDVEIYNFQQYDILYEGIHCKAQTATTVRVTPDHLEALSKAPYLQIMAVEEVTDQDSDTPESLGGSVELPSESEVREATLAQELASIDKEDLQRQSVLERAARENTERREAVPVVASNQVEDHNQVVVNGEEFLEAVQVLFTENAERIREMTKSQLTDFITDNSLEVPEIPSSANKDVLLGMAIEVLRDSVESDDPLVWRDID